MAAASSAKISRNTKTSIPKPISTNPKKKLPFAIPFVACEIPSCIKNLNIILHLNK